MTEIKPDRKMDDIPRTSTQFSFPRNGSGVQRHGLGLGLLAVDLLIAVQTVDVIVRTVGKAPRIMVSSARTMGLKGI